MSLPGLMDSDFFGSFESWTLSRRIFTELIRPGERVLDVGCANGFLLASLLVWHESGFEPFGFDLSLDRIEQARRLLPEFADNFWQENYLDPNWAPIDCDVVIAPWIAVEPDDVRRGYIDNCLARAGRTLLLHLYDDRLEECGAMRQALGQMPAWRVKMHIIPERTVVAEVSGHRVRA